MIDMKKIEKSLLKFESAEKVYLRLYRANPYSQFIPVSTWEEFVKQYKQKMQAPIEMPKTPPSDIHPRFAENQFFTSEVTDKKEKNSSHLIIQPHMNAEIVVFKHLRYTPIMMHSLEFVKVVYMLRGQGKLFFDDKVYSLNTGDIVIVGPDIKQAFFCNQDNGIVLNIIMRSSSFQEAFAPLLMEQDSLTEFFIQMLYQKNFSKIMLFPCGDNLDVKEIVLKLYAESQVSKYGSRIIMNSYVLLLFGQLIRSYSAEVNVLNGTSDQQGVSKIIQYIRHNRTVASLTIVAEHFNLSQGYLSRYIKKETGYSFSALLRELKMSEAKYLLTNSNLSIEEIIDKVGYTDISHFYRNFKSRYGMTPANYREHHK